MTTYTIINKANKLFDGHYTEKSEALTILENFKHFFPELTRELVENTQKQDYSAKFLPLLTWKPIHPYV